MRSSRPHFWRKKEIKRDPQGLDLGGGGGREEGEEIHEASLLGGSGVDEVPEALLLKEGGREGEELLQALQEGGRNRRKVPQGPAAGKGVERKENNSSRPCCLFFFFFSKWGEEKSSPRPRFGSGGGGRRGPGDLVWRGGGVSLRPHFGSGREEGREWALEASGWFFFLGVGGGCPGDSAQQKAPPLPPL